MTTQLPPHRTRRISLSKSQLRTELGAELLSLCESVTADGRLTEAEASALRQWLTDSGAVDLPAATYLREVVERVLADGVVTVDECREIYRAVEAVLPPEVRRTAVAARREVEQAERERNAPIASANFMVAGVRYEGRPELIARYARAGDVVYLVRDVDNPYSRNAVAVRLGNGVQIGFVPEVDAEWLAPLFDDGAKYGAYITKILTGGRSPIPVVQARLYRADSDIEAPPALAASAGTAIAREAGSATDGRSGAWLWVLLAATLLVVTLVVALRA